MVLQALTYSLSSRAREAARTVLGLQIICGLVVLLSAQVDACGLDDHEGLSATHRDAYTTRWDAASQRACVCTPVRRLTTRLGGVPTRLRAHARACVLPARWGGHYRVRVCGVIGCETMLFAFHPIFQGTRGSERRKGSAAVLRPGPRRRFAPLDRLYLGESRGEERTPRFARNDRRSRPTPPGRLLTVFPARCPRMVFPSIPGARWLASLAASSPSDGCYPGRPTRGVLLVLRGAQGSVPCYAGAAYLMSTP